MTQAGYTAEELLQLGRTNYEKLVLYCTNLEAQGFWEQARQVMKQSSTDVLDRYVQSVLMVLAVRCGDLLESQKEYISLITDSNPLGIEAGEEVDEQTINDCLRFSTFPPILIQLCGVSDRTFGGDSGEYFLDAFLNILLCMAYLNDGRDAEVNQFIKEYYDKICVFLNEYEQLNHTEFLFRKLQVKRVNCDVRWLHAQGDTGDTGDTGQPGDALNEAEAGQAESEEDIADEPEETGSAECQDSLADEKEIEEQEIEEQEERFVRVGGVEMQEPPEPEGQEMAASATGETGALLSVEEEQRKQEQERAAQEAAKERAALEERAEAERRAEKKRRAKEFAEFIRAKEQQEEEEAKEQFLLVKKRMKEREEAERQEREARMQKLVDELNELVGLQGVKTEIQSLINLIKIRKLREQMHMPTMDMSYHMVFTGAPGTGKTTVARIVARIYQELGILSKGTMIETDRSGLVAGYVGQTALKVHELVEQAIGGVLFIDEAYSLVNPDVPNDFGMEAVDTLVKLMEDHRDNLVIIVAGYTQEMKAFLKSNTGLLSRFNKFIDFPDYSNEELLNILDVMAENAGLSIEEDAREAAREYLETMDRGAKEEFGNARGIRNLFEKIVTRQANRLIHETEPTKEMLMTIVREDIIAV